MSHLPNFVTFLRPDAQIIFLLWIFAPLNMIKKIWFLRTWTIAFYRFLFFLHLWIFLFLFLFFLLDRQVHYLLSWTLFDLLLWILIIYLRNIFVWIFDGIRTRSFLMIKWFICFGFNSLLFGSAFDFFLFLRRIIFLQRILIIFFLNKRLFLFIFVRIFSWLFFNFIFLWYFFEIIL